MQAATGTFGNGANDDSARAASATKAKPVLGSWGCGVGEWMIFFLAFCPLLAFVWMFVGYAWRAENVQSELSRLLYNIYVLAHLRKQASLSDPIPKLLFFGCPFFLLLLQFVSLFSPFSPLV